MPAFLGLGNGDFTIALLTRQRVGDSITPLPSDVAIAFWWASLTAFEEDWVVKSSRVDWSSMVSCESCLAVGDSANALFSGFSYSSPSSTISTILIADLGRPIFIPSAAKAPRAAASSNKSGTETERRLRRLLEGLPSILARASAGTSSGSSRWTVKVL